MTTLAALKADISDDLDDTDGDYTTYIADSIKRAIKHYQTKKLMFNNHKEYTLVTVSGTDEYQMTVEDTDESQTYNKFIEVYKVDVEFSASDIRKMVYMTPEEFEERVVNSGEPSHYTYLFDTVKLHYKPNSASWTIHVHGHLRVLPPLADDEADNSWMLYAYDLIRNRVLADIFLYKLMQFEKAKIFKAAELGEYNNLVYETASNTHGTGIIPTQF